MHRLCTVVVGALLLSSCYPNEHSQVDFVRGRSYHDTFYTWQIYERDGANFYIEFDWSNDGCSGEPLRSAVEWFLEYRGVPIRSIIDFTPQCRRHDFGYRNHGLMEERWQRNYSTTTARGLVDRQLKADMREACNRKYGTLRHRLLLAVCIAKSTAYFEAVDSLGHMPHE